MKLSRLLLIISLIVIFSGVSSVLAVTYNEAPMLKEQVKEGNLPPVEERLPKEPYVVGPGDLILEEDLDLEIGDYGGTLRMARPNPSFDDLLFIGSNEPILWAPACFYFEKGIQGNVVKDMKISENNKVFTFYMREGLKWSDGHPVTTEDVRFAYEDVWLNEKITPIFPLKFRSQGKSDGEKMKLKIIDDYTFEISFNEPYGLFPSEVSISGWAGYSDLIKPAHYLKKYHIKYTPLEDMREELEEEELEDDWAELFSLKDIENWDLTNQNAVGFPVLYPWKMVKSGMDIFYYERNHYYFKVDEEGNQLPYIDKIRSQVVSDRAAYTMKAITGEVDFLGERASMTDIALFMEQKEKEDIKVLIPKRHRTPYTFYLNLTFDDPTWRKVVRDVRFRRALTLAIDREEVIETFYYGYADKPDLTPSTYDPEEAERLLDEMGMNERDKEGWRLSPEGEKFNLHIEVTTLDEDMVPITELLSEYWKSIGINTTFKQIDPSLFGVRRDANELMATAAWCSNIMWPSGGWDDYLTNNQWAPLWHTWHNTNGESGEEPPAEIKKLFDLDRKFTSSLIGSEESNKILEQIYELHYDNVFFINLVEDSYYPTVLSTKLGNVPPDGKWEAIDSALMYSLEQWFLK